MAARHAAPVIAAVTLDALVLEAERCCTPSPAPHSAYGKDCSARRTMRSMVITVPTGSSPMAVSPLSITSLAPSSTALATSVTSALVGTWACVIDSSIWVATTTGRA